MWIKMYPYNGKIDKVGFKSVRAWLVGGFLFLFSKPYKNNFRKIELKTSFQIISFILYMYGSHLKKKKKIKILKTKNSCLGNHFYFWDLKKKNSQKVIF